MAKYECECKEKEDSGGGIVALIAFVIAFPIYFFGWQITLLLVVALIVGLVFFFRHRNAKMQREYAEAAAAIVARMNEPKFSFGPMQKIPPDAVVRVNGGEYTWTGVHWLNSMGEAIEGDKAIKFLTEQYFNT